MTGATATAVRVSSKRGAGPPRSPSKRGSATLAECGSTPNRLEPEPLIIAGAHPSSRNLVSTRSITGWRAATTGESAAPLVMWLQSAFPMRWGERATAMQFRTAGEARRVAGKLTTTGVWSVEEA